MGISLADKPVKYETLQASAAQFDLNVQQKQLLFGLSPRTQARYKQSNPELNPLVADRLSRFQRLTDLAVKVFEDEREAKRWLSSPKANLDNLTPLDAMATDSGATQVEQMLYRIEYGVYA
ncbi:antitoxin Xre/MbcA/ParS toxin-binding domain-containing protein [Synechococcus sp. PCC 7336]|uniref:type II RES/Xre toxin-antitoxin system antitoxin n=1 Tax=Synechococcus sp. PCC 7336 TaxID=195250 RepID=UPI0003475A18|nr:antitoxin Xre/MbcA/ParS toxin-binding domain-containing protein [Synechococcus sp. PCC 7336]